VTGLNTKFVNLSEEQNIHLVRQALDDAYKRVSPTFSTIKNINITTASKKVVRSAGSTLRSFFY